MNVGGLRLVFWVAAIVFAGVPVFLEIVASPGDLSHLWHLKSYADIGRDLIFLAIAVLAIGLIDALETLLLRQQAGEGANDPLQFLTGVVLVGILAQLLVYCFWSAHMAGPLSPDAIISTLYVVLLAAISSLFARLSLLIAPRE